jgi:RND superfamily putative drug exporter
MVIAPAVVTLLGDRAWWLPGWLDRALPNVSLEGRRDRSPDERREGPDVEPEREKVAALAAGLEVAPGVASAGDPGAS